MLATDDILQSKVGSFEGTSGSATFDAGTTVGSPVFLFVGLGGDSVTVYGVTPPSGFEEIAQHNTGARYGTTYQFMKRSASAGETTWTINVTGGTQQVLWALVEWPGIDTADGSYLADFSSLPFTTDVPVSSRATDNSLTNGSYEAMALALHFATNLSSAPTITGHSANWQEIANVSRNNGTRWHAMSVVALPMFDLVAPSDTATVTPDSYLHNNQSVQTAVSAKHAANFVTLTGYEFGTATSMTNASIHTSGGPAPFDAVVGSPAVVTTNPRTGSYCLELSASAAAECAEWTGKAAGFKGNLGATGSEPAVWVHRIHFYFPTSLPGADVEIASAEAGSLVNGVTIWYRSASQKIGVKIGTGTEVLSDATVAVDTWIGLDYRYDPRTTTHTFDWQLDYDSTDATGPVTQTQASTAAMSVGRVTNVRRGWTTSKTATIRYDDEAGTKVRKSYPIGDINVWPLKVDPAGTPSVSGTTANFQTYTANGGTMTAFNAANVRNALDEIPPVVGASSDGVAQITTAVNDYVIVPMETLTAAPDNVLRGARWYFAVWAASGTAATVGVGAYDGVTSVLGFQSNDHGQDAAALMWLTTMHINTATPDALYLLTQSKVDAFEARMGWSSDASPDVGIHAVLVELVTQPAEVIGIIEVDGGAFSVYVRQDPDSGAVASYLATTPAGTRGGTLSWTIDGVDGSQYVAPNTAYEKSIGAATIATVTSVGFEADHE